MTDDPSIDTYVLQIIRSAPEASRPEHTTACARGCPQANWMRTGDSLRCYCHSMHAFTWPKLEVEDCLDRERALRGL